MNDPLAQLAEHLTFNQGVWSSNLQWVIPISAHRPWGACGHGGIGRRAGFRFQCPQGVRVRVSLSASSPIHAVVAQLVERHLAKVEVAGPSPVYRSILFPAGVAQWQSPSLPSWLRGFDSHHLLFLRVEGLLAFRCYTIGKGDKRALSTLEPRLVVVISAVFHNQSWLSS